MTRNQPARLTASVPVVLLVAAMTLPITAAASSITAVGGSFTHGQPVTIVGSGFGDKGGSDPNKPLLWADFELSIEPTSFGVITSWDVIQNLSRSSAAPQVGGSTNNVVGTFGTSMSFGIYRPGGVRTLYMYGKRRYTAVALTDNQKFFRIWADIGGSVVASTVGDGVAYDENCIPAERWKPVTIPTQQWNQDEFLWRQSTAGTCDMNTLQSTGNGYYEFIQNGTQKQAFINTFPTSISARYGTPNSIGIRVIDNFTDVSGVQGTSVYMDDLYMDDTFARVVIGNASTLAASTIREVQIPTAWADGSISVRVNRGTFGASAMAWLYVIDRNNNSSNGFPITFSTAGTMPTPAAPKNLQVR